MPASRAKPPHQRMAVTGLESLACPAPQRMLLRASTASKMARIFESRSIFAVQGRCLAAWHSRACGRDGTAHSGHGCVVGQHSHHVGLTPCSHGRSVSLQLLLAARAPGAATPGQRQPLWSWPTSRPRRGIDPFESPRELVTMAAVVALAGSLLVAASCRACRTATLSGACGLAASAAVSVPIFSVLVVLHGGLADAQA